MKTVELRARVRRSDKDIKAGLKRLNLAEGEMAILVREGVRRVLVDRGVMETKDDLKCLERRSE